MRRTMSSTDSGSMTTTTPRQSVADLTNNPQIVGGDDERFTGYGAMGVPFASGHYLVLRDMLASSVGPAYRAIWHRTPEGSWTILTTAPPELSCPRYFGAAATAVEQVPAIEVTWTDEWTVSVRLAERLEWQIVLDATPATQLMTSMGGGMPGWAWNSSAVLGSMGPMAGGFLRSGRIRLLGATPNGQRFKAAPLEVWRVVGGAARLDGVDLGALGPLPSQERLSDFWLPQRGLFFSGRARFTPVGPTQDRTEDLKEVAS